MQPATDQLSASSSSDRDSDIYSSSDSELLHSDESGSERTDRSWVTDPTLWAPASLPKRRGSIQRETTDSINRTLPRRYRGMRIRTHDDILQEQYAALRQLLDDTKNLSRDQLRDEHVRQTLSMIGNYKAMSKGGRARNVIISQSLPKTLRPASAQSTCSSRCSRAKGSSLRRSKSPARGIQLLTDGRTIKRVTFENRAETPAELKLPLHAEPEGDHTRASGHNYLQHLSDVSVVETKSRRKQKRLVPKNETHIKVSAQSPRETPGVYADINGVKHSDNSLKNTDSPDIKLWLKQKNKLIRQQKRQQREKKREEKEKEAKEIEEQKLRKIDCETKVKEWHKTKRKESLRSRGPKKSQSKIDLKMAAQNGRPKSAAEGATNSDKPGSAQKTPTPPTKPRPQSASPRRRVKQGDVTVATLIASSPELKQKLVSLEKQKRMKYRQSYEDWCKIKEREKRDTLKEMREQRQKLEREISEETARVIAEAARRRMDGIRYKGAAKEEEGDEAPAERAPTSSKHPTPYSWRTADAEDTRTANGDRAAGLRETKRGESSYMRKKANREKTKASKPNIEDKINPGTSNPFRDTFEAPKLRRPKSRLEQAGINGREFAEFVWRDVNEAAGNRPEPQGADSTRPASANKASPDTSAAHPKPPNTSKDDQSQHTSASTYPQPARAHTSRPPSKERQTEGKEASEPTIETGREIFSMTSIE